MTLNASAVSTPAPSGVVNNAGSTSAVNFDKFSAAPIGKRGDASAVAVPKDTRVAFAVVDDVAEAALLVAAAALVGKCLWDLYGLEQEPDGTVRTERQWAKISDTAQQLSDGLKSAQNAAGAVNVRVDMPTMKDIQKGLMSLYEDAKRTGGNINQLADRFAKQLTGQGGGASNVPAAAQAPQIPTTADGSTPSTAQPKAPSSGTAAQPVRPVAPPANTATQRQASAGMAAVNTLTQANTVAPNAYAAMEKFYQAASGGRAARAAGALNAPLQNVRQAYTQLGNIVATADKQIAASRPSDRTLLGQWRNTVAQSRQAIGQWLPGATAFAQGRSKPNGPATANPTMPRPPGLVLEPAGAKGQGTQGSRLADGYTQAARQAGAASPTKATTPTTAPSAPANTDQATQAMLLQSGAQTQRMNTGVQAFYQQAAGGQAARQRGALAQPLKQVAEARAGLNKSILAANKLMANSSAQARPTLEAGLKTLRQARDAVDAWLPQANAFAAGRSAPNGKRVANPPLPATPNFVTTAANSGPPEAMRDRWIKARNTAGNTLVQSAQGAQQTSRAQPSATVTNQKPSQTAAAPNVQFVDKFPPSVKRVAPVWVNPVTGEASATAKTGKDWVKAQVGAPTSLAANTGEPGKPGVTNNYDNRKQNLYLQMPGGGGGKGPNLLVLLGAVGGLVTTGAFVNSGVNEYLKRREEEWLETANTSFKPFNAPPSYANADAKAQGLITMWKSYLDQVPGLIEKNRVSESKSDIASIKKAFGEHAADFLQGLANDRGALKNMSATEKVSMLDTMAKKKLPEFSSTIKGTEQRPTKLMAALTKKLNESVAANSAGEIAGRRIAAQKPSGPAPKTKAETPVTIIEKAKPFIPGMNRINFPKLFPPASTKGSPPSMTPTARPSPGVPAADAAAAQAQAQAAQKKDEAKALNTVATAVKREKLESPPNMTALGAMRFTLDMFIDKSRRGDTPALKDAFRKAALIQQACRDAESGAAQGLTSQRVAAVPGKSVTAVLDQLNALLTAVYQRAPAAEPSTKPGIAPKGAGLAPQPTPSLDSDESPPPVLEPSTAP
jgi:hypothetical protein